MGKKLNYIVIAVIIINAILLVSGILVLYNIEKDIKAIESGNMQLIHKNKQLEESIAQIKKELELKEEEYIKIKEGLLQNDAGNSADSKYEDEELIKENETIVVYSPDGKYCAKAFGTMSDITAGGAHPYETIHVWEIDTGVVIWGLQPAGYIVEFIWSSDSRFLAVYYTGRIWGESIILDVENKKIINIPSLDAIASYYDEVSRPQENRPDPDFKITGFENADTVTVEFSWFNDNGDEIFGQYAYNFLTDDIVIK